MPDIDRRGFLKFAGITLASTVLKPMPPEIAGLGKPIGLGRITEWRAWAYSDPKPDAVQQRSLSRDTVLAIYDSVSTVGLMRHNSVWNLTRYGWIWSSYVQPVENQLNPVIRQVPKEGFWAQVSVPYTEMRSKPDDEAHRLYRLYYSSVHWVVDYDVDAMGRALYQLKCDQVPSRPEYVRAEGLRMILPEEMTPISPTVENKRIEVNLEEEMLYAYEDDRLAFKTRCATGAAYTIEGLGLQNFVTPYGQHAVVRKRPSRHMVGFVGRPDGYDLPGVPFCTYFTTEGAAVHGAYWHNDFGRQRSHGCVNVTADAAKWVYRWSMPSAPYEDVVLEVKHGGTPIVVT